jgi:anti-sigma regulatory factor (Ser/Thr protein kinase)/Na+-translocating ferredoxin:NAD+ oxidoreductase RNF subunit RnfB
MDFVSYSIEGSDYKAAGAASRAIKEHLKRLGADPAAIRRTMIAAYEAEMNVVIHARRGRLEASVSDRAVTVNVIDEGPGIPDIRAAMREGYSTAPPQARALGFGAGMGLPNIRRNCDRLRVSSSVGEGTRVSFTIVLTPQSDSAGGDGHVSLFASAERCTDCRRCLRACPTGALRVRNGHPSVLEHLCIECTTCIVACPTHALWLQDDVDALQHIEDHGEAVLVIPPALLGGFGEHASAGRVLAALNDLGFASVITVKPYEEALRAAVAKHSGAAAAPRPTISPACPAVVQLVRLRFPSLLPHVAPFASPWEALRMDRAGQRLVCVVSCPAQRSALLSVCDNAAGIDLPTPALVRRALLPQLVASRTEPLRESSASRRRRAGQTNVLRVTGMTHVLAVLEQIEDGALTAPAIVEPYACDGGCSGSPLLEEDGQVAEYRLRDATLVSAEGHTGRALPASQSRAARPGIRLDADMAAAIEKLRRLDHLARSLPGKDCSACGAPTCGALAEDIVMGRGERTLCPYADKLEGERP